MIKELMYKWFGLEPLPCPTCEVLKMQLATEQQFNRVMFDKLMKHDETEPAKEAVDPKLLKQNFVPWRVRQQMLEAEDRQTAKLIADKMKEQEKLNKSISRLEKETGIEQEAEDVQAIRGD